jgi:ketosteroid isomerase-like protein
MSENVELVRKIYEAWAEGSSTEALFDPGIEWVNPTEAVEPGTRRGQDSFQVAIDRVNELFEQVQIEPKRFVEAGDSVVVVASFATRVRGSGIEFEQEQGHVWTLRDGRAVRFQWFNDPNDAFAAAGILTS